MAFEYDDDNISDISNNFDSYMQEVEARKCTGNFGGVVPNDCSKCDGDYAYWGCENCPKK